MAYFCGKILEFREEWDTGIHIVRWRDKMVAERGSKSKIARELYDRMRGRD